MSWIDQVKTNFVITCGDGKSFNPLWINASKSIEYNISEFEFPELEGTLVKRSTPKGRRFPLEIYFEGPDHLDVSKDFENSAKDRRAWTISHPYYDNIIVQPLGLKFDNSSYNSTKITGEVVETITEDAPKITQNPIDKINFDKIQLDENSLNSYNVVPAASDINVMKNTNNSMYTEGAKKIKDPIDAENYFNAFNNANAAVNNATADPLSAIRSMQSLINAPALFKSSVQGRINLFSIQFSNLIKSASNITSLVGKKNFESNGLSVISSMALASSVPVTGDYLNRNSVVIVIEDILTNYNLFISNLDLLQSVNGGDIDSYIPDASTFIALNDLIKFTVSNLFNIALGAKQERSFYLEDDSNLILVAHRILGLLPDDSTLDELININNIGINEILQLRKGRLISYYV